MEGSSDLELDHRLDTGSWHRPRCGGGAHPGTFRSWCGQWNEPMRRSSATFCRATATLSGSSCAGTAMPCTGTLCACPRQRQRRPARTARIRTGDPDAPHRNARRLTLAIRRRDIGRSTRGRPSLLRPRPFAWRLRRRARTPRAPGRFRQQCSAASNPQGSSRRRRSHADQSPAST